jgi:hypothetical protein
MKATSQLPSFRWLPLEIDADRLEKETGRVISYRFADAVMPIQLSFLCPCAKRIALKALGCCRSCYDRRHSLRFFGRLRERVLERDRFRCHGCGKRSALVVHHRDRPKALEVMSRIMRDGAATHPDNDYISRNAAPYPPGFASFLKDGVMQEIWQREADDATETAIRLIMDDDGCIMFQYRSLDLPEWTDVDEVPTSFKFAV